MFSAGVACATLAGCGGKSEPKATASSGQRNAEPVVVAAVRHLPVTTWVDISGTLEPDERVLIAAKVNGRVSTIEHDLGDRVEAGAVLARIDDTDYQIALMQKRLALAETLAELGLTDVPGPDFDVGSVPRVKAAKAQAANAVAKRNRIAELIVSNPSAFSQQDFEDVKTVADVALANAEVAALDARTLLATVQTRRADVSKAQRDVDETVVRVPAGVSKAPYGVAARSVSVGDLLAVGSPVFTLVRDNPVKFTTQVPERYAGKVAAGQRVEVTVESQAEKVQGTVRRVSPVIEPESRTFQVQVEIANEKQALKTGGFARGRIAVGEVAGAVFVPPEAVVTFAGVRKVFSVTDGKAVEHLVVTGEQRDGWVQVVSGLEGVESVISKGAARLTRGVPVSVSTDKAGAG